VVGARRRKLVWDLGSNTGAFSRIASENADLVIAMDSDHLAIERLYLTLKDEGNTTIHPLLYNIADPSPRVGWRLLERKSLTDRGKPDLTICLALLHHLVIGANIPLHEIVGWLRALGTELVIEFVTKEDAMVKKLLLNKADDYADYEMPKFEHWLSNAFTIKRRETLPTNSRILYHGVPKSA
jgi:ribosomal protein L11 methylase PrmA